MHCCTKAARWTYQFKTQASKLGCIDRSKPQTLTVKLHIHNLSMIKLQLLRVYWLITCFTAIVSHHFDVDLESYVVFFARAYKRVPNFCYVCGQVDACVGVYVWFCSFFFSPLRRRLAAHVMMLGPRRPVLSWIPEILRAMAMRGPSTTWKRVPSYVDDHNSAVKHIGSWRCSMKMALITFVWSWIEIRGKSWDTF